MSKKISELTAVTDVTPSDLFQVVDVEDPAMASSGTNKKVTAQTLGNYLPVRALGTTTSRTLSERFKDTVNVKDFGAAADGIQDDSVAFQAAINALSPRGGTVVVPSGSYKINTKPLRGSKSIYWDFSPAITWSGAVTVPVPPAVNAVFPRGDVNISMFPVGPFIQSSSTVESTKRNATSAFTVEVLHPTIKESGSLAIYGAIQTANNNEYSNIWASNFVAKALPGAKGGVWGMEVDVSNYSTEDACKTYGINISGIGSQYCDIGMLIHRANAPKPDDLPTDQTSLWKVGIKIDHVLVGINLPMTSGRGIIIADVALSEDTNISMRQYLNNERCIFIQRRTDTDPTGKYIAAVNAANTEEVFSVDVNGIIVGKVITCKGDAQGTFAGALSIGSATSTTATAGSASALPSLPRGFITAYLGSIPIKLPYYNA